MFFFLCVFAGLLPDWLEGTLVRNGPGLFSVGETSYNHWFDGMALLHSFSLKNGIFLIAYAIRNILSNNTCCQVFYQYFLSYIIYSLDLCYFGYTYISNTVFFHFLGEVTYRSRFLRGDTYNSNIQANRIVVSEMGTMAYPDPCKNIFSKWVTVFSGLIVSCTWTFILHTV